MISASEIYAIIQKAVTPTVGPISINEVIQLKPAYSNHGANWDYEFIGNWINLKKEANWHAIHIDEVAAEVRYQNPDISWM